LAEIGSFDQEADVVVVGLGCAGACAAIEARLAGADVLVLERAAAGGGTSAMSGGLIYLGGGTPVQKACGFEDTPEEMFKLLMAACGPGADEAKVRVYCEESVEHFHWLVRQGVPFKESFWPEPSMEPPGDDCLVYSGGEDAFPFDRIARPAPRAHKPRHPAAAGGFLMQRLLAAVGRSGARVVANVRAQAVVREADGRVAGLVARSDGRELRVRARRGVVLAAGGFSKDPEMLARHAPLLQRCGWKLEAEGCDGQAIRMAVAAGAEIVRMDAGECALPLAFPNRLAWGIVVNGLGQRYVNEDTYAGRISQETVFRQNGQAWFVVDAEVHEARCKGLRPAFVEEKIEDLERAVGLPAGSLVATLELYNRFAARGEDPLLHKKAAFLKRLDAPPFAAIDCRVNAVDYASFTLGGLRTSAAGEVLTPDGTPIAGLFAAGRTSYGIAGPGYVSGISLGDGTFFGRKAGRSAAAGLSAI
jgi:3-oxo-5alpha-steroid 4-dehydrogenase